MYVAIGHWEGLSPADREWLHVKDTLCIYNNIHSNSYVLNHTGESIEVLDIGLRRTGGVPVVQRVKPHSPTHRLSVGSPRRHNAIK